MAKGFQTLPGFRDFKPEDCAVRNYLFQACRRIAQRYGCLEYETPILEDTQLYLKKSGGELSTQLFRFTDQGGRDVTLRPEVTASLARLAIAVQREYPKPLRWFEIGQCFRYEKPQKGRLREFYQFNVDLLGEPSPAADAELIALSIDLMRELGFTADDFIIRLSDRHYWQNFAKNHDLSESDTEALLQIVDKLERHKPEDSEAALQKLGLNTEIIRDAIENPRDLGENLNTVVADLSARGMGDFLQVDLSIVRGLAYYTGVVFEVFDQKKSLRAVAGGGRYDTLVNILSDGDVDLPAVGFAMGDVVIRHFIEETPHAHMKMLAALQNESACEVFLIIADESKRPAALGLATRLRAAGIATTYPLALTKVGKQFKQAPQSGARFAAVIGEEFPEITLKILSSRSEEIIRTNADPVDYLLQRREKPDGPLLA